MSTPLVLFALGLGSLLAGAHALLRGAAHLARHLRISTLWIGFVLVAIGTSLPELVVSLVAGWKEQPNLVFATIIGSNTANLGLILALGLLVQPFKYSLESAKEYARAMLIAGILLSALSLDGILSRGDGLLFLVSGAWLLGASWKTLVTKQSNRTTIHLRSLLIDSAWVMSGVLALWIGGHILVESTIEIARSWRISEELLGLSLVAIGTSLPELITTLVAAHKRQTDVALGNILGSNTVNILFILGLTLLLHPITLSPILLHFDLPVSLLLTSITTWLLIHKKTLGVREGLLLLIIWSTFLTLGAWLRI